MYGYANLPTLVLNEIFGFLSVKQRVRCKCVCRSWKAEIELREQKRDALVLHFGPYLWNVRWCETNNRRPMKFENSFEVKRLTFLKHPLTRSLLKIKKLAIVQYCRNNFIQEAFNLQPYLIYLKHCEEIELRGLRLEPTLTFNLPKLKVLVLNNSPLDKLVLNCPSLEVLFWNQRVDEIHFQSVKKLKRLICFGWPAKVSPKDKMFERVEYLNFFTANHDPVKGSLLNQMPKLKRFVLYSSNPQTDLEIIRAQESYGLNNMEILLSGFRDPTGSGLCQDAHGIVYIDKRADSLLKNYPKLVENSPWRVCINYSKLYSQFGVLPSNFFERFHSPSAIEISSVRNYMHLLGFLKCYPFVEQLYIHWSKVDAQRILDLAYVLQPSLTRLTIVEERPSAVLAIDLSFMRLFNLAFLFLECTHLPVDFLLDVAIKRGPHLQGIVFEDIITHHLLTIYFKSHGFLLVDFTSGPELQFDSLDELISAMQSDPQLSGFLL